MKIGGSTAWRIITQPISDRSLSDALIALRHGNPCPQVLQSHLRVAKQSSIGPSARRPCPQIFQRHPRVADHPPTDLKTVSFRCHNRSSARRPCPEGHQSHPCAIPAPSSRYPRIIPAWQIGLLPNVGRFGAFFMDIEVLIGCSSRSSARRPCLQVLHSHLREAKQSSIGPSARRPCLQAPQSHLHVAKRSSDRSLERPPRPQMPQWPPR